MKKLVGISFDEAMRSKSKISVIKNGDTKTFTCGGVPILFDSSRNTKRDIEAVTRKMKEQKDGR